MSDLDFVVFMAPSRPKNKRGFPKRLPKIRYAAVHYFAANAATLR